MTDQRQFIRYTSNVTHERTGLIVPIEVRICPSHCGASCDITYSHLPRALENGMTWASGSHSFGYDLDDAIMTAESFLGEMADAFEIVLRTERQALPGVSRQPPTSP